MLPTILWVMQLGRDGTGIFTLCYSPLMVSYVCLPDWASWCLIFGQTLFWMFL